MLDLGFGEILVIVVLAIVVVGPDKLPETLRFIGRQYGKLMKASNELRRAFMAEADRADAEERARELKKKRDEARARATAARARATEEAAQKALAEQPAPGGPMPRADGLASDPAPGVAAPLQNEETAPRALPTPLGGPS